MTASRDPDRLIHAFLDEGLDELPDPVYDAVRDRIEQTRQRAFIGPWRTSDMNRYIKIGLAAAAVVLVAIVGYQLLGLSNTGDPAASETPQPTATSAATAEPSAAPSVAAGLPPGPFALAVAGDLFDLGMTVTIAADDWDGAIGSGVLVKSDKADPPDGAGLIVFTGDLLVYGDPCQWSTTQADAPATTVDELVAALSAQASRDATAPVDVAVGDYAGKSITLHVPEDAAFSAGEFTDCDEGDFGSWTTPGNVRPERYSQGPGQIDELWILDVNGVMVVIDTAYYAGTPAENVDEMRAIVESATFELP